MKRRRRASIFIVAPFLMLVFAVIAVAATKAVGGPSPDRPPFAQEAEGDYLRLRDEHIGRLRGLEPDRLANPAWRASAVQTRLRQEAQRDPVALAAAPAWAAVGPHSVSNGQALDGGDTTVSGRVTAIAVDPTNSNKVYLGTAQGGVWRSLNGGSSWLPIFDSAQSLSIGALAVAPSNPSVVYVGTGEAHQSRDSFFGVGVYRIDTADTTPTLAGPINPQRTFTCNPASCAGTFTTNTFTGRSISRILVDPTNAATIFVSTSSGNSGLGFNQLSGFIPPLGLTGVYRSTNATAAVNAVAFDKLAVGTASSFDSPPTGNRLISNMTFVNGNPNTLLVSTFGTAAANDGGIFRSTNALAATPTFTHTLAAQIQRIAFGVTGNTVLAATSESTGSGGGRLRQSTDGGATWPTILGAADGFCGGQCFYDIVVGIDPQVAGPNFRIYLGGSARGSVAFPQSDGMQLSNDGGATFTRDDNGLHADTHAIVFDTSTNPSTVWTGSDGGVWKRSAGAAAGTLWTNLNNALTTLQFESVAVGSSSPVFGIGGTQDNGTEIQQTSLGNWSQADYGDGGYALIDQSTTSTTNVTMYHTYFNQTNNLIGFGRTNLTSCAVKGGWSGRGFNFGNGGVACDGTTANQANGISGTDAVAFYAPIALGPGTPNTLYFGTDRLYRSTNRGDTMLVVSQAPIVTGIPITAIGISPTSDNVRIVGLQNGQVWRTTTGSSTLGNVTSASFPANPTGSTINKWIGRAVIDPNNPDTAYVTFSFYAPAGQGVWKTTNLSAATPTWTAAASGIPSVPVNAFVVDPNDSTHLFAGTDVGVFASTDGGATWTAFGTGLPTVAVFDMEIVQPGTPTEKLRVATHGRSMWEADLSGAATAPDAPTGVSAVAGDAQATVSWTPPASDGGSPITNYVVTPYIGATGQTPTQVGNVTSSPITGLTNGTSYTFRVAAKNVVGTGPQSAASNAVTPQPGGATCNGSAATITGTSGNDTLTGTAGVDVIVGLGGNDVISGLAGNDKICAGSDDDVVYPGSGNDQGMDGGTGSDTISYADTAFCSNINLTNGDMFHPPACSASDPEYDTFIGFESAVGGAHVDVLIGSTVANRLTGGAGADQFTGLAGNDTLLARDGVGAEQVNCGADTDSAVADASDVVTDCESVSLGSAAADFDGDGDTDLSVFRPSQGAWYIAGQPPFPQLWGSSGDLSVSADYDGDGSSDIAVFRNGHWYVQGQPPFPQIWGQAGDVPVPADYDGDGDADIAVFRNGHWYVQGQPPYPQIWGQAGDVPVPADYDGDGDADIAVFRNGHWYVQGQPPFPQIWGQAGDVPVPADYDGDGDVDIAVFRNGHWYVKDQPPYPQIWGQAGDLPVPGDYDASGDADIAVFRDGHWYVQGQPPYPQIWGAVCDIPQPLSYALRSLISRPGCTVG